VPVIGLYVGKSPALYTNADVVSTEQGEYFGFIVFGDNHAAYHRRQRRFKSKSINRETRFKKMPIDFVAVAAT
jgi:hypothetical protein